MAKKHSDACPRNLPDEKRCTARSRRTHDRCRQPRYKHFNVCFWHGGAAAAKNLKHGRRSKNPLPVMEEEIERHLVYPEELKKIDREIAIARALQDKKLEAIRKRLERDMHDPATLKAFVDERASELKRMVEIGKALLEGQEVSKTDREFFLNRRIINEITPEEEAALLAILKVTGDLVAKKAKIEDGVKVTLSIPELGILRDQLRHEVKETVREMLGPEMAEEFDVKLSGRIRKIRLVGPAG